MSNKKKTIKEVLQACEMAASSERLKELKDTYHMNMTAEKLAEYDNKVLECAFDSKGLADMLTKSVKAELIEQPVVMEEDVTHFYRMILKGKTANPGEVVEIPNPFTNQVYIYTLGAGNLVTTRKITAGGVSTVTTVIRLTEDISIRLSVLQSQRYNTIPIYRSKISEYLDRKNDYYAIQAVNTSISNAVANLGTTRTIAGDFNWANFKVAARMIQDYGKPKIVLGTLKNAFKISEWKDSDTQRIFTYTSTEKYLETGSVPMPLGAKYIVVRGKVTIDGVEKTLCDDQTVYLLGDKNKVGWWTDRRLAGVGTKRKVIETPWNKISQDNDELASHVCGVEDNSVDVYDAYVMVKWDIPMGT